MRFGSPRLSRRCALIFTALTYSQEHHHAEHGQQGGDDHAEEHRQLLGLLPLLAGALPDAARLLLRGLAGVG